MYSISGYVEPTCTRNFLSKQDINVGFIHFVEPTIFLACTIRWAVDGDISYRPTAEAAGAGEVEEDEDEDAIAARRARVRDKLRARRAQEAEVLEVEHEEIAKWEKLASCKSSKSFWHQEKHSRKKITLHHVGVKIFRLWINHRVECLHI